MLCIGYLFVILAGSPQKTATDLAAERRASLTCTNTYGTCLKRLTRRNTNDYRALCKGSKAGKAERTYKYKNYSVLYQFEGDDYERLRKIYYPGHRE